MRLQDYSRLIQAYLPFAAIVIAAAGGICLLGYFLIYKRLLHGTKRLRAGTAVPVLLLGVYLLFLCCITLLNRSGGTPTGVNLTPFTSWREAWYRASPSDWRYIIFNIIAFVPLGILLPLCSGWFDRWRKILCSGLGCSLLIEITQLITGRGLFETDDLIHNTLGTAIGYGFLCLFLALVNRTKKSRLLRALISQIPFLSVTVLLCSLFVFYQCKELGNLSSHYIYPAYLAADAVSIDCTLSNTPETVTLCRAEQGTRSDTDRLAEKLFALYGLTVDTGRTDYYDYTAIYYLQEGSVSLWIEYDGMTWTLRNLSSPAASLPSTEADARRLVEQLGVCLPAGAAYTPGEGCFTFAADMLPGEDGSICNGSVTVSLPDSGQKMEIKKNMMLCRPVRETETISASEAAGKLVKGQFRWDGEKIGRLSITGTRLGREIDSKGYYQPVWKFSTLIDGQEYTLSVPALP